MLLTLRQGVWDTLSIRALTVQKTLDQNGVWVRDSSGWYLCQNNQCVFVNSTLEYPFLRTKQVSNPDLALFAGNGANMLACRKNESWFCDYGSSSHAGWLPLELGHITDSIHQVRLDPQGHFWFLSSRGALQWIPNDSLPTPVIPAESKRDSWKSIQDQQQKDRYYDLKGSKMNPKQKWRVYTP